MWALHIWHRVPLIIRWPGHVKAGTNPDQIFSSLDWVPTLVLMIAFGLLLFLMLRRLGGAGSRAHASSQRSRDL